MTGFPAPTAATSGFGSGRRTLGDLITHFPQPAPVALPGPRSRTDGAGGRRRHGGSPCRPSGQAARGRSTHFITDLRSAPRAFAGARRGVPASGGRRHGVHPFATHITPPDREAGLEEENKPCSSAD